MPSTRHEIRLLTRDERNHLIAMGWTCGAGGRPRCQVFAVYRTSYEYVTGRSGRTSTARKNVCGSHAAAFAKTNGLEMPAVVVEPCNGHCGDPRCWTRATDHCSHCRRKLASKETVYQHTRMATLHGRAPVWCGECCDPAIRKYWTMFEVA